MSEAVDEFISSLRGRSKNTKMAYASRLRTFETIMGPRDPGKRTFKEVNEFIDFLEDDNKSSGTVAQHTIVLRAFFGFYGREDLVRKIKTPTVKRKKRKTVNCEDWHDMFEVAGYHATLGDRNQALLSVLLGTGMRVGEAVRMRCKHIDWESERIFVPQAKGDEEVYYMMVLKDELDDYLRPWIGQRREAYVFPGKKWNKHLTERMVRYLIKKIASAANVPNADSISPHSLRHSLAHYLLFHEEWDIEVVRQVLNHKRIETTQIYTDGDEGGLELAEFVKRNRPGA